MNSFVTLLLQTCANSLFGTLLGEAKYLLYSGCELPCNYIIFNIFHVIVGPSPRASGLVLFASLASASEFPQHFPQPRCHKNSL